jgi:hypothetical protein
LDGKSDHANTYNSQVAYSDFAIAFHNANLDILGSRLDHLEQTFHRQFDAFFSVHVVFVILLQKLSYRFRRSADRIGLYGNQDEQLSGTKGPHLPSTVDSTRFGLV